MGSTLRSPYLWIAIAFAGVAVAFIASGNAAWIAFAALSVVFFVIASQRRPKRVPSAEEPGGDPAP
jgi:hypothetical protein